MPRLLSRLLVLVVLLALAAALYWWWQSRTPVTPDVSPSGASLEVAPEAPASQGRLPTELFPPDASPLTQEPAPEVQYPIDTPSTDAADTEAKSSLATFEEQVFNALGLDIVQRWFLSDRLIDRFVATVDNLARSHASPRMWPLPRTAGSFETVEVEGRHAIAPSNAARYDSFILLVEGLPLSTLVELYRHHYPKFQQSYQSLGYPNAYFNDRLVAVIDHLIATPDITEPVGVHQVEIKGPLADSHPITHFVYNNPQLEQGSAGRKILWRMSPAQRHTLIEKLQALRKAITT